MRTAKGALGVMVAGLAFVLGLAVDAQVVVGKKATPNLETGLVTATKEKKESVEKIMKALGPAIQEQLTAGRQLEIPGVGTFRVVKVEAYRDLVNGRPAVIPERNFVEFLPAAALNAAANAPGSVPARVVPPAEFRVNPAANPGIRNDGLKTPRTRSR
jgi:nucleoid DNA-binding protein